METLELHVGIGAKSALSYTNTFYIITTYNNVKYHYMMSKDAYGIPEGTLLKKEEGDFENGTLIKIPIKSSDISSYMYAFDQVRYIHTLYVENKSTGSYVSDLNSYKIYDSDKWTYRKSLKHTDIHICLGNIQYSLDYSKLGLNRITVPIAIKFEIGELQPTPSREDIVYSKEAIKLINDRIYEVFNKFYDDYQKTRITNDFKTYLTTSLNSNYKLNDDLTISLIHNLSQLGITGSKIAPIYIPFRNAGIEVKDNTQLMFEFFKEVRYVNGVSGKLESGYYQYQNLLDEIIYVKSEDEDINHIKSRYILENITNKRGFFIVELKKSSLKQLKRLINLKHSDIFTWRKKINVLNNEVDTFIKSFVKSYDDVLVNPNWLKTYKSGGSFYSPNTTKKKYNLYIKEYDGYSYIKKDSSIDKIKSNKGIILYSNYDNKNKFEDIYTILYRIGKIPLYSFICSNTNYKKLKDDEIGFSFDDIMEGKLKTICNIITAHIIMKHNRKYYQRIDVLEEISPDISKSYLDIITWCSELGINNHTTLPYSLRHLPELFKENDLLNNDKLNEFYKCTEYIDSMPFLDVLRVPTNERERRLIADIVKMSGKKVDLKYYVNKKGIALKQIIEDFYEKN